MNNINFRAVEPSDCDILFKWINDPLTRKNSYNSNEINYNEHVAWFNKNISKNWFIFYTIENSPIGVVRFDCKNDEWIIGISIDSNHRGKGYAMQMIKLAVEKFIDNSSVKRITAYIKEENISSKRAFRNAGFCYDSLVFIDNQLSYKMIYLKN